MTSEQQDRVIEIVRRCVNCQSDEHYQGDNKINCKRTISFSPPDISELEINEVRSALGSGWITTGPRTKLLERRLAAYIETGRTDINCETEENIKKYSNRVVCLNSATAAEELNLRILGVGPGDEVIVPAYTYTATASAAIHCGATVKFVDIQKDGDPVTHMPEMDYDVLEDAITEKTKAIVTVDLGGIVCDYDRIFKIVNRKKSLFKPLEDHSNSLFDLGSRIQKAIGRVAVVADSAHSLGASRMIEGERKYCGAIADFTDFSFHAVKNFTTAEGGASTWKHIEGVEDSEIYKMYQLLSLHGQDKDAFAKAQIGAWEYDIVGPWYKCNMTDIMAAIGLRQLDRYKGLLERRSAIIKKYDEVCDELGISHLVHHTECMDSSNHLYLIRISDIGEDRRNKIITGMAEQGVSVNVHYKPLPMMTAYGRDCSAYPSAYHYYRNLISLPLHTLLSDDDVDYVCRTLKRVLLG
ncbi:MAG: DegT/DnrJ/EryC1/StrS family aminotransferase [Lachnospiraceae bacterium]|nr:DegT/DnrJ/EryC1/StrS family aminotransferase [Lachnospiraceae bacterium]